MKRKIVTKNRVQDMEKGQSLVEMAISMVFLLMIMSGLFDLGRMYYIFVALEDAAGEAALFLAMNPTCENSASATECADPNNAVWRATNSSTGQLDWNLATVDTTVYGASAGEPVIVSITFNYQLLSPFIPQITGVNPLPLTASASQIIITE